MNKIEQLHIRKKEELRREALEKLHEERAIKEKEYDILEGRANQLYVELFKLDQRIREMEEEREHTREDVRKRRLDEMGDVAKILRTVDKEIVKHKALEEKWRESYGEWIYFKGASFSLGKLKEIIMEEWSDTNLDGQIDEIETSTKTKQVVKPRELKW